MLTATERERYLRHILLREVGAQGQMKLKNARVVLAGAGGLGAPILFYLAGAGVGRIDVYDDDIVDRSNLQRQIIYRDDDLGASKAERAAAAAAALNPDIEIVPHKAKLQDANAPAAARDADILVEGVDSFEARYAINRAAIAAGKPLVSAAIGRFEGQLGVFAPHAGDYPCYRCFAPTPPPRDEAINCADEGVLGPLAGVMGALAALETIKTIAGFGESLAGRLLIYDGLAQRMRNVALPRDPACVDCGTIKRGTKDG